MVTLLAAFLLTLLLVTAIGIVRARNLFEAVMLAGIYSLEIAAVFFVLDAADVALTEAAVGAGVATVLFLGALALTEDHERRASRHSGLALLGVASAAAMILYPTLDYPRLGDPESPVHQHVAQWYLANTGEMIDVPNVVTAILASFRGYDTFGELFVILTAGVGVLFLLMPPTAREAARLPNADRRGLRHHLVPRVVGLLLVPFIVLFGLYVQFHGDYGPGGGFQAGALVTAGLILHALLEGEAASLRVVSTRVLVWLMVGGAMLYGGTGIAGMLLGGNFLDYNVLGNTTAGGQHLGILLVEIGVGLTVTGVLMLIFHAFAARRLNR